MNWQDAVIAGIDPGKTGALSIVYPDGFVECYDVPVVKLKGKTVPAWSNWFDVWQSALGIADVKLVVIEDVASRPGQGVTSMFSFGRSLGFVHAIAAAERCSVQFVSPSTWKGKLGLLNSSKGASREKATMLYPKARGLMDRVKDDGRAEAILLAHYGRKYL